MSSSGELAERLACYSTRRALGLDAEPPAIGPYRVIDMLGRGAFGRVWRATDPQLEREVAIKITSAQDIDEARSLAAVKSPYVVAVYSVEQVDGHTVTVMERVEGMRMDAWAAMRPPVNKILRVLHQVGQGLVAIHGAGLAHRDLKPTNIMIDERGNAKIVDLGLARVELANGPIGTEKWAAPEAIGGRADARSDVYSFGLVCEWALGQVGEERLCAKFCARALKEDARERWATIAEGLEHLPHQHPRRWRAMLAAVAFAGALIGGLVVWWAWPRSSDGSAVASAVQPCAAMVSAVHFAEQGRARDAYDTFASVRPDLRAAVPPSVAARLSGNLADAMERRAHARSDRVLAGLVAVAAAEAFERISDAEAGRFRRMESRLLGGEQ